MSVVRAFRSAKDKLKLPRGAAMRHHDHPHPYIAELEHRLVQVAQERDDFAAVARTSKAYAEVMAQGAAQDAEAAAARHASEVERLLGIIARLKLEVREVLSTGDRLIAYTDEAYRRELLTANDRASNHLRIAGELDDIVRCLISTAQPSGVAKILAAWDGPARVRAAVQRVQEGRERALEEAQQQQEQQQQQQQQQQQRKQQPPEPSGPPLYKPPKPSVIRAQLSFWAQHQAARADAAQRAKQEREARMAEKRAAQAAAAHAAERAAALRARPMPAAPAPRPETPPSLPTVMVAAAGDAPCWRPGGGEADGAVVVVRRGGGAAVDCASAFCSSKVASFLLADASPPSVCATTGASGLAPASSLKSPPPPPPPPLQTCETAPQLWFAQNGLGTSGGGWQGISGEMHSMQSFSLAKHFSCDVAAECDSSVWRC